MNEEVTKAFQESITKLGDITKGISGESRDHAAALKVDDCNPHDSASLDTLRRTIDDCGIWETEKQEQDGDYDGCVRHMAQRITDLESDNASLKDSLGIAIAGMGPDGTPPPPWPEGYPAK